MIVSGRAAFLIGPAIALAFAGPCFAQAIERVEPIVAKQCAVWAAVQGSDAEGRGDAESAKAFEGVSQYFVGLYEGLTGRSIDDQPDAEMLAYLDLNLEEFDGLCGGLARQYGQRMTAWGATLSAMSEPPTGSKGD